MLVEAVGNYLATKGVGTVATSIFLMQMPTLPINCVAINPSSGIVIAALRTIGVQVLIRNSSPEAGLTKAELIYSLLHDSWGVLTGYLGRMLARATPGAYFFDEANNTVYTLNFYLLEL